VVTAKEDFLQSILDLRFKTPQSPQKSMRYIPSSPDGFADYFNRKVPGAYRQLSPKDVEVMTEFGLIGHYC